jgi:hypothetical protein
VARSTQVGSRAGRPRSHKRRHAAAAPAGARLPLSRPGCARKAPGGCPGRSPSLLPFRPCCARYDASPFPSLPECPPQTHAHTHTSAHMHTHNNTHAATHTQSHTRKQTCNNTRKHTHAITHTSTHIYKTPPPLAQKARKDARLGRIREYFYGAGGELQPHAQSVAAEQLQVFRIGGTAGCLGGCWWRLVAVGGG